MAINNVGPYTNYAAIRSGSQARPAVNAAPAYVPAAPSAYTTAPSGGAPSALAGGLSLGRLASWAGGAFASWKYVLPLIGRHPGGLLIAGVLGAGAFAGNWVYNKLTGGGSTGAAPVGGSGQTMRYASWAGGAAAAWKWVLPMIGRPTALMTAGVLGAGAFAGNWIYNQLTGR